ncbi:hypothetical protein SEA_ROBINSPARKLES_117 [Gordonia phage RobinSparkles]|nr:hypothetical protein SEA_ROBINSPARKLES_117 [Gordonia phage RobinSparkles]
MYKVTVCDYKSGQMETLRFYHYRSCVRMATVWQKRYWTNSVEVFSADHDDKVIYFMGSDTVGETTIERITQEN